MVESWHYTLTKVAASPSIIKEAWIRIIDTDPASASLQSFIDQTLKLTKAKVGGVVKLRQNNTCCCCHNKNFLQTSDKPFGIKINQRVDQQAQGCCMALPRPASSRSGRSTFCHKTSLHFTEAFLVPGETFAWFMPFWSMILSFLCQIYNYRVGNVREPHHYATCKHRLLFTLQMSYSLPQIREYWNLMNGIIKMR